MLNVETLKLKWSLFGNGKWKVLESLMALLSLLMMVTKNLQKMYRRVKFISANTVEMPLPFQHVPSANALIKSALSAMMTHGFSQRSEEEINHLEYEVKVPY